MFEARLPRYSKMIFREVRFNGRMSVSRPSARERMPVLRMRTFLPRMTWKTSMRPPTIDLPPQLTIRPRVTTRLP